MVSVKFLSAASRLPDLSHYRKIVSQLRGSYNLQVAGCLEDDASFDVSGRISHQDVHFLDGSTTTIFANTA